MKPSTVILLWVVGLILVAGAGFGSWQLYWVAHRSAVNREYSINREGQPMQAGTIAQARDYADGYHTAIDPAQKQQLASRFCAVVQGVPPNTMPPDLASDQAMMCPPR